MMVSTPLTTRPTLSGIFNASLDAATYVIAAPHHVAHDYVLRPAVAHTVRRARGHGAALA